MLRLSFHLILYPPPSPPSPPAPLNLSLPPYTRTHALYVQRKESIRNQAEAAWQLTKNEKKYVSTVITPCHVVTVSSFFIVFLLVF